MNTRFLVLAVLFCTVCGCHNPKTRIVSETETALVEPPPKQSIDLEKWDYEANQELRMYFNYYNAEYFAGRLPNETKVGVSPHVSDSDAIALTSWTADGTPVILVDERFADVPKIYCEALLHEMVHVDNGQNNPDNLGDPHGPAFKAEIDRLKDAGAFDSLL